MPSKEFGELVARLRANPIDPRKSVVEVRRYFETLSRDLIPPQDAAFIKVDADGITAEWTRVPESEESAVLFYLHGGGYMMGAPETHRDMVARICKAASIRALSIDYRLAPENPFPAALEDAVKSYNCCSLKISTPAAS